MIAVAITEIFACILIATAIGMLVGYRKVSISIPFDAAPTTPLTIIVAAHNEERKLPILLDALQNQSYPHKLISVILVDDRSSDRSSEILASYSPGDMSFSTIRVDAVPDGISPKKYALAKAIDAASTEFLLFTDADCLPERDWVSGLVSVLKANDVVLGSSPLNTSKNSFFGSYARYESLRTQLFMHSAAGIGMPYMSLGRNWGYRKSMYQTSGGLEGLYHILGGDDDLLLQQFTRNKARVGSCLNPGSSTLSSTATSLKKLFDQKSRHYSVSKHYAPVAAMVLAFIQLSEITLLISGIFSLTFQNSGWTTTSSLSIAILVLLWISLHLVLQRQSFVRAMLAPFWEVIHLFFSSISGIRGLFKKASW